MELVDPSRPLPLTSDALGLHFEGVGEGRVQPRANDGGAIVVRLVPFSLPPRFLGWATTADASAAVLSAAEGLAGLHGLANGWLTPHPAGASLNIGLAPGARYRDGSQGGLGGTPRVVVDGAGVAGAALALDAPDNTQRRNRMHFGAVADELIEPVIRAAADILRAGEVVGRAWCQVDLIGLGRVLLLEGEGNQGASGWVPSGGDLTLPAEDAPLRDVARRAIYAYARSAGLPAWDPPIGTI